MVDPKTKALVLNGKPGHLQFYSLQGDKQLYNVRFWSLSKALKQGLGLYITAGVVGFLGTPDVDPMCLSLHTADSVCDYSSAVVAAHTWAFRRSDRAIDLSAHKIWTGFMCRLRS